MSSSRCSSETSAHETGRILAGKYAIVRKLGSGACGEVYEATNLSVDRPVAIKILSPALAGDAEVLGRFHREARAACAINHPNIVSVFDMGRTDEGLPFIVMELLQGRDLQGLLDRRGRLEPRETIEIALQLLAALGAAHRAGVVHRDLKPSNVFLACRGEETEIKILDFGVAKCLEHANTTSPRLTRDGTTVGTPSYMSPEQASGRRDLDARSDLYSVGVLLYEMLSGRLPHEGQSMGEVLASIVSQSPTPLSEVAPNLPPGLGDVVDRALARSAANRFQSAVELAAALEPLRNVPRPLDTSSGSSGSPPTLDAGTQEVSSAEVKPRSWRWPALVATAGVASFAFLAFGLSGRSTAPVRATRAAPEPPIASRVASGSPEHVVGALDRAQIVLSVDANVPGARVMLGDEEVGTTPLRARTARRSGTDLLSVEAASYHSATRTVRLDGDVNLFVELSPVRRAGVPRAKRKIDRVTGRSNDGLLFEEDFYQP